MRIAIAAAAVSLAALFTGCIEPTPTPTPRPTSHYYVIGSSQQ